MLVVILVSWCPFYNPNILLFIGTCNCPRYILTNFIAADPYVVKNTTTFYPTYTGVFPFILQRIVDTICSDCINGGPSLLSYNVSLDGLMNEKENIIDLKNGISDDVQVTFPMFGKFEMTRHAGQYPYIGMVNSQGIAVLKYQPRIVAIGVWRLLTAVMGAWPVIMVAVLMCSIVGILFWFTVSRSHGEGESFERDLYGKRRTFSLLDFGTAYSILAETWFMKTCTSCILKVLR